ncbi:biotin carboxylase [Streptomyces sp. NPDC052682]|uniref:ATP-grasp domain-containing protein n=1 Tax=Streptomyces sp. NPDC052682 TaxID=3154954 RepID=UPI00343338C9
MPALHPRTVPVRSHVILLHRWRDRHADYASYLDHDAHTVSYVTTSLGRQSVPEGAAGVVVVDATDDLREVRAAVASLVERFGSPDALVALNEGDLDTAAAVRDELGCPGQGSEELARFRDKLAMVAAVRRAGIPVPPFADAPGRAAVVGFARHQGWPVVVKPRRGTASRGVRILLSEADAADLPELFDEQCLVQSFVPHPIVHIDGVWDGKALGPWRASRYLRTCREFTEGDWLGSVEIDDSALLSALETFTAAVAAALDDRPWVFHLEAFLSTPADGPPAVTFLEAGARVGGAEIPFVWREVHGIDLMRTAFDIQLGRRPSPAPAPVFAETGGWLLIPLPVEPPCRVEEATAVPALADGLYAQVVPEPGAVMPKIGGYEHVGARFRFRGSSSQDVEGAVEKTAAAFRLRCTPVAAPAPQ